MNNDTPELVDSVLEVRCVGSVNVTQDLELQDGKSISELLDEQTEEGDDAERGDRS
jgi:hypothetical protein